MSYTRIKLYKKAQNLPIKPGSHSLKLLLLLFLMSKFPSVVRDLALVVAHDLPVQTLLDGLRQAAPDIVSELEVFDVYQGKGIDPDKKSLAIRVVMKDTQRTLADDEVESARSRLIRFAEERFSARLRA